jgi:alpha-ribazole phosphatase
MEIYLIRHTEINGSKSICYGQSNPPLSDTFLEEAAVLKAKLPTDFDAVYSSPLLRCKLLAEELGFQNIQCNDALKEVNFGTWEGKLWNEIPQNELDPWMNDFVNIAPPEGESLVNMFGRVSGFLDDLRKNESQKTLIVCHAGVIRCIIAYLLSFPLQNVFKIQIRYAEIFKLEMGHLPSSDKVSFR